MEMSGEQRIPASQDETWKALNDPDVLKACIPGCESITLVNENEYNVAMTSRVGPVSAKFRGRLQLSDIKPPHSYSLTFEGQGGAAGFAKGAAQVKLVPAHSETRLLYDVKANVGGKLAQIGSRLIDAAAKKVADDFFQNFNKRMAAAGEATVMQPPASDHPAPGAEAALPSVSNTTLMFFAAGSLVVVVVALVALFG